MRKFRVVENHDELPYSFEWIIQESDDGENWWHYCEYATKSEADRDCDALNAIHSGE